MMAINFDPNQFVRIKKLILLKGECLEISKLHMENYSNISNYSNFYSSMSDVIDVLLTSQINDELTSASNNNRYPLIPLLEQIYRSLETLESQKFFHNSQIDLEQAFTWRTDFLNGSHYLDFTVSSYSVFECWVSKIYDGIFDEDSYRKKRVSLALKYLSKIHAIEKPEEKEKNLIKALSECSLYISGAQKIQQVIKLAKEKNPSIDNVNMLEKIMFYGSLRNTIHNLGRHQKKTSQTLCDITLEHQEPAFTTDYSNYVELCRDIVYIYKEIIESIGTNSSEHCINTKAP